MDSELVKILLASSVVAGVTSAVVSYLTSIRLKRLDFKNDYYKEILKKRLEAYQFIENQIAVLKGVVLDDDKKAYHMIFCYGENKFLEYQQNLAIAISQSLWIDDSTVISLENINALFFSINSQIHLKTENEIILIGKKYYKRISDLRFELENSTKIGLYNLHDIRKGFKTKPINEERIMYKEY